MLIEVQKIEKTTTPDPANGGSVTTYKLLTELIRTDEIRAARPYIMGHDTLKDKFPKDISMLYMLGDKSTERRPTIMIYESCESFGVRSGAQMLIEHENEQK